MKRAAKKRGPVCLHLGIVVATPNAIATHTREYMTVCLARHQRGDWGDIVSDDWRSNDSDAIIGRGQCMSVYKSDGNPSLWIVTDFRPQGCDPSDMADNVTTLLLPEDY